MPNSIGQIVPGDSTVGNGTTNAAPVGPDPTLFVSVIEGNMRPQPFTQEYYHYTEEVEDYTQYFWQVEGAVKINGIKPSEFENGMVPFTGEKRVSIEWDSLGLGFDTIGVGIIRVLKKTSKGEEIIFEPQNEAMARWGIFSSCLCEQHIEDHADEDLIHNMDCQDPGNGAVCPGSLAKYRATRQAHVFEWEIYYITASHTNANHSYYRERWQNDVGHSSVQDVTVDWYTNIPSSYHSQNSYQNTIYGSAWATTARYVGHNFVGNAQPGDPIIRATLVLTSYSTGGSGYGVCGTQKKTIEIAYTQSPQVSQLVVQNYFLNCNTGQTTTNITIPPAQGTIIYEWQVVNPSANGVYFTAQNAPTAYGTHLASVQANISNVLPGVTSFQVRVRAIRANACGGQTAGDWKYTTIFMPWHQYPTTPNVTLPITDVPCKIAGTQSRYRINVNQPGSNVTHSFVATPAGTTPGGAPGSGAILLPSTQTYYEFNLANVVGTGTVTIGHIVATRYYCNRAWTKQMPVTVTFPAAPAKPQTPTFTGKPCTNASSPMVSVPPLQEPNARYKWHIAGNTHYFLGHPNVSFVENDQASRTVVLVGNAPLQVWVEYIGCGGYSLSSDVLEVPINQPAPTPQIAPIGNTYCTNQGITYCIYPSQPGIEYTWVFTDGNGNPINYYYDYSNEAQTCVLVSFGNPRPTSIKAIAYAKSCGAMTVPSAPYTVNNITWVSGCPPQRLAQTAETEPEIDATVKAYPNPTSADVQVNWTDAYDKPTVRLYNSLGQLVTETRAITGTGSTTLKLQGLAAGIYHVHVTDGKHMGSATIVKQD